MSVHNYKSLFKPLLLSASLTLTGCDSLMNSVFSSLAEKNLPKLEGQLELVGLENTVTISRDDLGVPLVEAGNMSDLAMGMGYMMAQDRLAQMTSMSLLAQGRLSEMTGELSVDMDMYMRTLNLNAIVARKYERLSDEFKVLLQDFSHGVNAYIEQNPDAMPLEFQISDYQPEAWQPENTIYIFAMLNLGVGFNLHEELGFLKMAAELGLDKAVYLAPIYPDQPLDHQEAQKLAGIDLAPLKQDLALLDKTQQKMRALTGSGIAASNNWAVHKDKTRHSASLVANDTHLLLTQPSTWMLMQVKTPEYSGAGVTLAGVPALVAGYNGHIGWGETMVMADSQDLFLEKLKDIDGKTHYLYQDQWYPVEERHETIKVKGGDDVSFVVKSTRHGPLMNDVLKQEPKHTVIGLPIESEYGLALSMTATADDNTVESFFALGQAKTMDEAQQALNGVGFIHLNVIYGDKDNIAWQVTGLYPDRKKGTGHFPSPGWTGEYDWQGIIGGDVLPVVRNPQSGHMGTGNHRTVDPDYPITLTNSWYYPERSERIDQLLASSAQHDVDSMMQMQADRTDVLLAKVQTLWAANPALQQAIDALPADQKRAAQKTFSVLQQFDGDMQPESSNAAVWGVFETELIQAIFRDELGADDSTLWQAFLAMNGRAYSGYQDHLLARSESPFWDNSTTEAKEDKEQILAQALASTWSELERLQGKDESEWQWGNLVNYHWQAESTKMRKYLSPLESWAAGKLANYIDRGPYPAGGNRNTLNVAGFDLGSDYDAWNIPAMRLVVDFSSPEPLFLTIAGGQSANPASPHYDDGIELWMKADNRQIFVNDKEKVAKQFNRTLILNPAN